MFGKNQRKEVRGFTLIELLIVVAIIAILAAIAVPNFLEAQTRAKVSRTKADIRTQATALEAYFVDWNAYTRDSDSSLETTYPQNVASFGTNIANGAVQLTTPIAYMSSLLTDPFAQGAAVQNGGVAIGYRIGSGSWSYPSTAPQDDQGSAGVFAAVGAKAAYVIIGVGPDKARARCGYKCFPFQPTNGGKESPVSDQIGANGQPVCYVDYDPTNGTTSLGDVYQMGGSWNDGRFMRNGMVIGNETSPGGEAW